MVEVSPNYLHIQREFSNHLWFRLVQAQVFPYNIFHAIRALLMQHFFKMLFPGPSLSTKSHSANFDVYTMAMTTASWLQPGQKLWDALDSLIVRYILISMMVKYEKICVLEEMKLYIYIGACIFLYLYTNTHVYKYF